MEARFADTELARRVYPSIVQKFIDSGVRLVNLLDGGELILRSHLQTTTCCYFSSIHLESTKVLADVVHELGMAFLEFLQPLLLTVQLSQGKERSSG